MSKPVKPVVPPPALRSEPDTFKDRAEANIEFFEPLVDYMDDVADFVDEQADAAVAAAQAGDLPPIAGKAGKLLRVNATGDGLDFQEIIESAVDPVESRVLTTGAFGLGVTETPPILADMEAGDTPVGIYRVDGSTLNKPAGLSHGIIISGRVNNSSPILLVVDLDYGNLWSRAKKVGVWSAWQRSLSTNDYPSQVQAEAGSDNTKVMTPLRTKQAIAKFASGAPQAVLEEHTDDGVQGTTVTANVWGTLDLNTATRNLNAVLSFDAVAHTFTPTRNGWTEWSYINRDIHQTRLYCVTDGVSVGLGVSVNSAAGGQAVSNGGAPVEAGKTYRLEVNKNNTVRTYAASRGDGEVYSRLLYWAD